MRKNKSCKLIINIIFTKTQSFITLDKIFDVMYCNEVKCQINDTTGSLKMEGG